MSRFDINCCPAEHVNRELRPGVIPCAVFSPPYNCNIDYDGYSDFLDWPVYKEMASASCTALWDVMAPGGRVWCNVQPTVPEVPPLKDGKGKKQTFEERINLAWIWENALRNAGFAYRDTIVWMQDSHDGGTAWGSYRKPSAPNLRGGHELILNFYKPPYKRETPPQWKGWEDPFGKEDWPELTRNVWKIPPSRSKDHKATYPVELAQRAAFVYPHGPGRPSLTTSWDQQPLESQPSNTDDASSDSTSVRPASKSQKPVSKVKRRKKRKPQPTKAKIERLAKGIPLYWNEPLLVIDRSHIPKCSVSRIPLMDPSPENVCMMIEGIAKALNPPEATWYIIPAKPHKTGNRGKRKGA